ncbi:MAG: SEC-C metal-binding domain-containing protein [Phycisphaerae bacterium]
MSAGDEQFKKHYERRREAAERYKQGLPGEDDQPLPPPPEPIRGKGPEPGRNDPCPCGSGKKYKHCCLKKK